MASSLLINDEYITDCDSVKICLDLWILGKGDPLAYVQKAAQRKRLGEKGLDDCIPFCHTPDSTEVIPGFVNNKLINLNK